ncbi:MAG: ATP-binding protein, partial [Alphaproteobacteria bacterium]|nr:ATP-binding protein [Alphaproteobacteria bacterium]
MKPRAVLFWSGGKDSGLALDRLRRAGDYEIAALITTVNAQYGRVSMHGVREELVAAQARAAGLPLDTMYVGPSGTNEAYVAALRQTLSAWRERGVETVAVGDIFLADLRQWREGLLA